MQAKDQPEQALRVLEVGRRLGMSPHSVRALIRNGHLPAFRVGPHLRVWPASLDGVIRSGETGKRSGEAA